MRHLNEMECFVEAVELKSLTAAAKALKLPKSKIKDPATLYHLGSRLIRKKPKLMPRLVWKMFLFIVLAPSTRNNRRQYSLVPL